MALWLVGTQFITLKVIITFATLWRFLRRPQRTMAGVRQRCPLSQAIANTSAGQAAPSDSGSDPGAV